MEKTQLQLQSNRSRHAVGAFVRRSLLAATVIVASLPLASTQAAQSSEDVELAEVVVTGTMLRRTDTETVSPVTVLTADDIEKSGQTTVQDALQNLASNNGPALNNNFGPNGAFADGASAVSLRGMSTNSTLVLFDGMRAAYYPLADDGARNFVDLNTIPDDIVERVEILRDGASSLYGADAIAGVVNIITKKSFQGLSLRAEGGIPEIGAGANSRFSFTAGKGDLDSDGYNVYASGFFYDSNAIKNSELGFPYNTDDNRALCYTDEDGQHCGTDTAINGLTADGTLRGAVSTSSPVLLVREMNTAGTVTAATAGIGRYRFLNTAAGCGQYQAYSLNTTELASATFATTPTTVCRDDWAANYYFVSPNIRRLGFSSRITGRLGETSEAYAEMNIQQANTSYASSLNTIYNNAPTGIEYPRFSTASTANGGVILSLPVYVCAARVSCATAADRQLNPNNPFASANHTARLIGRLPYKTETEKNNRVYRFAAGLNGSVSSWDYDIGVVGTQTDLRRTYDGYVYIQHLLDVIADGSYNFVNPAANTAAMQQYLMPTSNQEASSNLVQLQVSASRSIGDLPGGPAQLGIGATIYREEVNSPSGNPDYDGPTERYFTLNAFGAVGHRTVSSAFAEASLPVHDMVEVNLSGRYDDYSSGQNAFSPKVGLKFKPISQIALRGNWSKGFRIPSFGEANSLPTTGYVTVTPGAGDFPDSFLAQYGCSNATFTTCPAYVQTAYSYGLTSLGTAGLKPERSKSLTYGLIAEPFSGLSLTVDYYNIQKTNAITGAEASLAMDAYYAGAPIPAGFNVIAGTPSVAFPNAQPLLGFVESGFVNANKIRSEGIDYAVLFTKGFGAVKWTSAATASYIIELSTTFPSGRKESYAGTLGNYNLTAGSGTPRWHGDWANTIDAGKFSATLTMNYFDGYNLSAADQGDEPGDCGQGVAWAPCDVKEYLTFDLTGRFDLNDTTQIYAHVMNLTDKSPPLDPVTYGAYLYNSVQGGNGILGRSYRLGVKLSF